MLDDHGGFPPPVLDWTLKPDHSRTRGLHPRRPLVFLPPLLGGHFPAAGLKDQEENMNLRSALKAPQALASATQNATIISIIALIVAGIALIAAVHKGA
jgi:hypothetical protein